MEQDDDDGEGFQSEPEIILVQHESVNDENDENKENEDESSENKANGDEEDEVPYVLLRYLNPIFFRHPAAQFAWSLGPIPVDTASALYAVATCSVATVLISGSLPAI